MLLILRQLALTVLSFGLLYATALALTFVVEPPQPRTGSLDVWTAPDTLYLTTPKYAFLARDVLNVPQPKVLLIGASNTGMGLKQPDMQKLVSCAKVSNLAIGSANISELHQMVDLVHEVQSPAARKSNTFVIGIWFGMFVDTEQMWPGADRHHGDTDLDIERYRYSFYRRTEAGPVPVLPVRWLHLEATLIRPYLLLERVARDVTAGLRHALFVRPPQLTDADRETMVMSQKDRADALAAWQQTLGNHGRISSRQVALLSGTIEDLLRSGENVVLVDLPIPAWHRAASPYQPGYAASVETDLFAHFATRPHFVGLKMPDLTADSDFSDEVHAKPHVARLWATRLAGVINPLVCPSLATRPTDPIPKPPRT